MIIYHYNITLLRHYLESNASCSRVYTISRGHGSIRKRKFIYLHDCCRYYIIIRIPTGYATRRNTIIIILYRVGPNKDAVIILLLFIIIVIVIVIIIIIRTLAKRRVLAESPPPGCIILYTCCTAGGFEGE